MYLAHYGLNDQPFSISPNPRYLYLSEQHQEALACLNYGIQEGGGFVVLTGEVGTGKTTLCRALMAQLPQKTQLAYILNPAQSVMALLRTICLELQILSEKPETDNPDLVEQWFQQESQYYIDLLNHHLLTNHQKGIRTLLIIDEAQALAMPVLEQLRLLTNLETNDAKLLQIVLLGQPELQELLALPSLRQLSQRITARFHLEPLSLEQTQEYIRHRLNIAGLSQKLFSPKAVKLLFKKTQGVPRLINLIADRALLGAYAQNEWHVTPIMVKQAAIEVLGKTNKQSVAWYKRWPIYLWLALLFGGGIAVYWISHSIWFSSPIQLVVPTDMTQGG
jgi:general secretion pathway protein A